VSRELVLKAPVAAPSTQAPGLPPAVDKLCLKMLARTVSQRPQTAGEVVQMAEDVLAEAGAAKVDRSEARVILNLSGPE
jgi:hypothetical protein